MKAEKQTGVVVHMTLKDAKALRAFTGRLTQDIVKNSGSTDIDGEHDATYRLYDVLDEALRRK